MSEQLDLGVDDIKAQNVTLNPTCIASWDVKTERNKIDSILNSQTDSAHFREQKALRQTVKRNNQTPPTV